MKRNGQPLQTCGIEETERTVGFGKGMRFLTLRNGQGAEAVLSLDRGLDIFRLNWCGVNMGYLSPNGAVAPTYYDECGFGFVRSYSGGFLTTFGLTAVGPPCEDGGNVPLHGRISNVPCEDYQTEETEDELVVTAHLRETSVFGEQMTLTRQISLSKTDGRLTLFDRVKNIGTRPTPCGVLYNMNFGYPFLCEETEVVFDGRDERMPPPSPEGEETCLALEPKTERVVCGGYNPRLGIGVNIAYQKSELGYFTRWRCTRSGGYVLALEPASVPPLPRDVLRKQGQLRLLESGEETTFRLELTLTRERSI